MIVEFIVQCVVFLLWLPMLLLKGIDFFIPDGLYNSISWAFQYMPYIDGELPLHSRPEMTGPVSYFGLIDILVVGYNFIFWFYFFKLLIRITSRFTGFEVNSVSSTEKDRWGTPITTTSSSGSRFISIFKRRK